MTQKAPTDDAAAPGFTIEDIYNLLMAEIEPELMTDMVAELDTIYKDETKEQRKERAAWYTEAFAILAERMSTVVDRWKAELRGFKTFVFKEVQNKLKAEDTEALEKIEQSLEDTKVNER